MRTYHIPFRDDMILDANGTEKSRMFHSEERGAGKSKVTYIGGTTPPDFDLEREVVPDDGCRSSSHTLIPVDRATLIRRPIDMQMEQKCK